MATTDLNELLTRNIVEIIEKKELEQLLHQKKQLRVKYGIDPTSDKVHLGHASVMLKLRDFQEAGHKIVLIIGDFTATIGDTSDKESERPMLTIAEVKKNLTSYLHQVGKIINLKEAEVHHNSTWLEKLSFSELSRITTHFTLSDFISRDNIARRLQANKTVSLRELLYPIMQGYDSAKIKADIELGGTEQRFNMLAGRKVQELFDQPPQQVMTLNLLLGTDGKKMSKSTGNTINLTDSAKDMFGKIMRLPDEQIAPYYLACTRIAQKEIDELKSALASGSVHPKEAKLDLAETITAFFYGEAEAKKEKEYFISVFSDKERPEDIPEIAMSGRTIVEVLVGSGIASSNSDARRLIEQGSITIDAEPASNPNQKISAGSIIKKGKRFFVRVTE